MKHKKDNLLHSCKNKHILALANDADQSNVTTGTCSVASERREDIFCLRLYYKSRAEE